MAEGGHPSVYVVDSYDKQHAVLPQVNQRRKHTGVAQTLMFLLLSVALCGIAIEACFIYNLYQSKSDTSASFSKLTEDEHVMTRPNVFQPSKPAAHLTDGQDVVHGQQIMEWSMDAEPVLYEMDYNEGSLLIQKEGLYYVYSKISFLDTDVFYHSIDLKTKLYNGKSIPLLNSRKYSVGSSKVRSNSYLGGVFHLHKGDAIFVKVSNCSKILRYKSYENIFGAYMI